jgi:hypothetical protein
VFLCRLLLLLFLLAGGVGLCGSHRRCERVNHIANELMGLDWEFYSIEEEDQLRPDVG